MSPQNGIHGHTNKVSVVLGAQWGDEGKGKYAQLFVCCLLSVQGDY